MKIELKNGEIINTISDFNFNIQNCLSCKYNSVEVDCDNDSFERNICQEELKCEYQFVGIKSIEMKVKTDE